ncbi:MAG: NRDE family protein [Thermoguttaceae bacterium]|nr:NRDE family protein [Thermoguttaceae bacterium]
MGILAIQYQTVADTPILLAVNREESPERPAQAPRIQSGRPRMVCGIDKKSGGTWAGVNQHGMFVTVINAPKQNVPAEPRSRGLLCKDLLACRTAEEAIEKGAQELCEHPYAGCNIVCVDRTSGGVIYGSDVVEAEPLEPGLHIISENPLDDRDDPRQEFVRRQMTLQRIDSPVTFFAVACKTFARKTDSQGKWGVVIKKPDKVTVSSILLSLSQKNQRSIMQYAPGSPSEKSYEDISALLRQVLSTDRAASKSSKEDEE